MSSPTATILRDGNIEHLPSIHVVVGDVIELKIGDVEPADLRLFESMNYEADESLLTGETLPAAKDPNAKLEESSSLEDRNNMTFSSTKGHKG